MKKTVLWALLDLVFIAVFNTVFFILRGTEHPASVWISYGFIHFAYLMVLATPYLIRKGGSAAVFGFSIYYISSIYFFVEFIAGLVFIFMRSDSMKAALVTQVILAGIYAVILLSDLIANEHTADAAEKQEGEVAYIKAASARVKALIGRTSDKKASKAVEKAYDALHASPTKTNASLKPLETEIIGKVAQLEQAVSSGDAAAVIALSGDIASLAEDRRRRLRLSN